MRWENIEFPIDTGVARLVLNRPTALNSFTAAMHAEVRDALTRAADDPQVRAVLLTGAGRGFCAGQDLNDRAVSAGDGLVRVARARRRATGTSRLGPGRTGDGRAGRAPARAARRW